ncbi:site-specific integrase [Rhodoferax sp.]|uniref:tyrosine-type recombinase/integrase n=1 Tax=Rhodoferax sp. TaxID=50421 RepID=UPI0025F770FC|nr:site-specific integrase [Rhodoferax sp.]
MSVYTDKNGRYHASIMRDGKRVHRTLPAGATARDAKLVEAQLLKAVAESPKESRKVGIPGDPPLTEVMALYVQHAKGLKDSSTALHHAARFGPWAEKYKASQAGRAALHFTNDCREKYAAATINWSLSTLKKGLKLAKKAELASHNYADEVELLKVANIQTTSISLEQLETLASHCSDAVKAAVFIAIYTGCRRGEIVKMRPEHIDRANQEIEIHYTGTKTSKTRTIPIVAPLAPWLDKLPLGIGAEGIKSGFTRARVAAGMPWLNFKDLRRSCAKILIKSDVELYVVSKLLGHSTVVVTQQRYGHLETGRIKDGLDKAFK